MNAVEAAAVAAVVVVYAEASPVMVLDWTGLD